MNIDNFEKFCIVGWGKTGISLVNLLLSLNKKIMVTEVKERSCFPFKLINKFKEKGVKFEFGGHSENFIKEAEMVILSPGVDPKSSVFTICQNLNIPYVGEIEFAFWLTKAKFIAITGTNGKTTTAFLTYRLLKEKRKRVFLGGNIGIPLSSFVLQTNKNDLIVLEVSSFQLETIVEFRPYIASFLNIEPDHFDRYPDFEAYLKAKMNIFKNQKSYDYAVINAKLDFINERIKRQVKANILYFSSEFSNDNFSCAYRIASLFGVSKLTSLKIFSSFKGLPHRLEFVKKIKGINFINDSKATNPSSTIWAIKNTPTPIILIAGGRDKGVDYSSLLPYLRKVKKVNLFGEAAPKIKEVLNSRVSLSIFSSLEEAVLNSFKEASSGDTVLFSPMCASFDMFSSYRERGKRFKEIINQIGDGR
jgi:UDP-N-acetylmuramoylalanine--D-glutamate ligase